MHNKKVLSEAVAKLGKKKTSKPYSKDIIKDPAGQWKYPGENTRIPSNQITMKGVNYPVWAQPNVGQGTLMYPGEDYHFPNADYVDEYPQLSKGGIPDLPLKTNRKAFKDWTYSFEKRQEGGANSLEGDLISKVIMNRNKDKGFVERAYALGANPGTSMFNVFEPDEFGQTMSHKMGWGTDDEGQAWMFPTVLNPDNEAITIPNQYADYISSQGYKNATGMNNYKKGGNSNYIELELTPEEIKQYRDGGYVVEDISIPELTKAQKGKTVKRKPLIISDPKEFAYRDRAYKDSLDMYKNDILATKYHNLTNNAQSMSDMAKYMKLETLATNTMEHIKKKSPAKFGSIYAKQKAPVQPVQLAVKEKVTSIKTTPPVNIKTKQPIKQKEKLIVQKPVIAPTVKQEPFIQEEIGTLPLRTLSTESTLNPEFIPGHYLPPMLNLKGHWSDGSDGDLPKGMSTEDFKNKNKAHRAKFLQEWNKGLYNDKVKHYTVPEESRMTFQEGGSIELDLTPEEIEHYKKLGYSVDYLD